MASKTYLVVVTVEEHDEETNAAYKVFEEALPEHFTNRAEAVQAARDILD